MDWIKQKVDRLFRELNAARGDFCHNPITGTAFVWGDDPIEPQKRDARRALFAREIFALSAPLDAPLLPLSYDEREDLKSVGGLSTFVALYARSLEGLDYDTERHPPFQDYVRGAMVSEFNGYRETTEIQGLRHRFPPRQLNGLGPGLYWQPTKQNAEMM